METYKTFKAGNEILIDATLEQNAEQWVGVKELELANDFKYEDSLE